MLLGIAPDCSSLPRRNARIIRIVRNTRNARHCSATTIRDHGVCCLRMHGNAGDHKGRPGDHGCVLFRVARITRIVRIAGLWVRVVQGAMVSRIAMYLS